MQKFYEEYKYYILAFVAFLTVGTISLTGYFIHKYYVKPKQFITTEISKIDIGVETPETHYIPSQSYFDSIPTASIPSDSEGLEVFTTEEVFGNDIEDSSFEEQESSSFEDTREIPKAVVSDANAALFDLADKYFQVYWNNQRLSPIVPLAVANVETPGRADNAKTWSALFPSRYVDIGYLYSMDVTTVVSDASIYKPLSKEYSTRDRGALQMSPTYGTGNDYFNSMMSGTEAEKLSHVDTSAYSSWASGASSKPGDRFYIPDVCLRLSAAYTDAISRMVANEYTPDSDYMLIAMCAMYHQQSGVWSNSNHSKAVGKWRSGEKALEYARSVSSVSMLEALRDYALEHPDKYCIDSDTAKSIYSKVTKNSMSDYATKTIVCTYPIKVEYAYIKLCIMYGK